MKALTIWQPWASMIMGTCTLSHNALLDGFALPKDVENRGWSPTYAGYLLVHAGKRVDRDYMDMVEDESLPAGAILGVVELHGCTMFSQSRWAARGQHHWKLENPRPFSKPIPYIGKQGFFEVPDQVIAEALVEISS